MLSGNGRHRRPRQAPAIVVTAGVTGSALALPLLATGSASAADAATWDRVAACESGGQWSANFGNGAYGGLQMTQEAWERHGGLAYAPSPDLASRAQQIAIADKALASGSTDWATCAPIAGLENDGRATGVQPGPAVQQEDEGGLAPESNRTGGTTASSAAPAEARATGHTPGAQEKTEKAAEKAEAVTAPAKSATPSAPATSATPAPTGTGTATPPASTAPTAPGSTAPGTPDASTGTPGTPVTPPDASESPLAPATPVTPGTDATDVSSATPGTGKHRGEAAPEETGVTDTDAESGRHAAAEDKLTSTPVNTDASDAYTVRPGDSLSEIARENDLAGGWDALYDANRQTVGADPDLILPGQSLELTTPPSEK
ncbi:transglycosylase family protein [Streptomyces hydrogenans]|uniref:transglycosylase family protein n=1 Tax=Streptomyces hydrogenans TaxID=1873719 RepID=UPI0035D8925F